MTLPKYEPSTQQRYKRNRPLARYIGVHEMTLRRWKADPKLNTPPPMVVNNIEYNDVPAWDDWLKKRAISGARKSQNTADVEVVEAR